MSKYGLALVLLIGALTFLASPQQAQAAMASHGLGAAVADSVLDQVSSTRCITAGATAGTAACGSIMATGIERLAGEVAIGAVEAGDAGAIIGMIMTVSAAVMEIEIATATGAAETVAIKNAAIGTAIGTRVTGNCVRAMGRSFGERPFCRIPESPTAVVEGRSSRLRACGRNEGEGAQMVSTILDPVRPPRD